MRLSKKRWHLAIQLSSSLILFGLLVFAWSLNWPGLVSPLVKNPYDGFYTTILPKLDLTPNSFKLIPSTDLISSQSAITAPAYLVIDFKTGQVLAQKAADQRLPIASLTKIFTAVTVLDLASPTESFNVPAAASLVEPTNIGVVPGQKMTVEELLNAALLTSANDAVAVLSDGLNRKYKLVNHPHLLVESMNAKAQAIGLQNSHFVNPQGFDDAGQYSTAEDLAVVSHYALTNYPLVSDIAQKSYQFLPADQNHKQFDLYNWNGLMNTYPGIRGLKIGNTDAAGYTMVAVADRGDSSVMVVLLGAPGILERDLWVSQLLDLGFTKLAKLPPVNLTATELHQKYSTWRYGADPDLN